MFGKGVNREVEIKLPVQSAAAGRSLLRNAGFKVARRRRFESNIVFDRAGGELRKRGVLLRLRGFGRRAILTFKGKSVPGRHKTREEIELAITKPGTLATILQRMGFREAFRYEKYRTYYELKGSGGVATLDETPVGVYIELEGTPGWIDRTAKELKFTERDYITKSYGRLYIEDCHRRGLAPGHMIFKHPPRGGGARNGP